MPGRGASGQATPPVATIVKRAGFFAVEAHRCDQFRHVDTRFIERRSGEGLHEDILPLSERIGLLRLGGKDPGDLQTFGEACVVDLMGKPAKADDLRLACFARFSKSPRLAGTVSVSPTRPYATSLIRGRPLNRDEKVKAHVTV